jgi:hypothetical protein
MIGFDLLPRLRDVHNWMVKVPRRYAIPKMMGVVEEFGMSEEIGS